MTSRPVAVVTGAGRGIGRAIAVELARRGFDLALPLLEPEGEEAEAVAVSLRAEGAKVLQRVPAGRWGEPEDVAAVVSLLAEGRAAFATGSVIAADGGLSIPRL